MRFFACLLLLAALVGCQSNGSSDVDQSVSEVASTEAAGNTAQSAENYFTGTVMETMNSGGYTYVKVDTGDTEIWAAGPQQTMETGTSVLVAKNMAMQGFHSDTLDRDFDVIYFVSSFSAPGAPAVASNDAHASPVDPADMPKLSANADVDLTGIESADQTVADIFKGRAELAGKQVRIRGKVVKALPQIMGKNWLHIQDGTEFEGDNDLTITTSQNIAVGSLVVIEGVLSTDRDFGAGYRYTAIVEDAKVTVE